MLGGRRCEYLSVPRAISEVPPMDPTPPVTGNSWLTCEAAVSNPGVALERTVKPDGEG